MSCRPGTTSPSKSGIAGRARSCAISEAVTVARPFYRVTPSSLSRELTRLNASPLALAAERILGLAADEAKIVSVGQDGRLCVWRFSQCIDTAFLRV